MTRRDVRAAREYLIPGYGMHLPEWFADWLERNTNVGARRVAVRGQDRAVDELLLALLRTARHHAVGSADGSEVGTSLPVSAEPAPTLDVLGVAEAGGLIGVSDRAVRRAIYENRLPAQRVDGRWLINRTDAEQYRQNRTAA